MTLYYGSVIPFKTGRKVKLVKMVKKRFLLDKPLPIESTMCNNIQNGGNYLHSWLFKLILLY